MFTARRVREYLDERPFRPIRIYLSDDSFHDVPHVEFAWLIGGRLFVAEIVKDRGPDDPRVKEVAILHITRIEPLPKRKASGRARTKK